MNGREIMRTIQISIALFFISFSSPAAAQEYPVLTQFVYGTIENDSMTIVCEPPVEGRMRCKFTQVMVSKVGRPGEFEKSLPNVIAQLLKDQKGARPLCDLMQSISTALRAGIPPKGKEERTAFEDLRKMPQRAKDDFHSLAKQASNFCTNPDRQTAEDFLRAAHDRDLRTCKIWTNTFEQTFTSSNMGQTWIVNDGPEGLCDVVVIAKLEKDKDAEQFWTYRTRKIVMKKDVGASGLHCSLLDEREYFYDWKEDEKFLGCDYVKFGF
jgi:hypothetical protein